MGKTSSKGNTGGRYAQQTHEGFAGAWNPTGLAPEAEKALADRGLITKPTTRTSSRKAPAAGKAKAPAGSALPRDLEAELPARAKKNRAVKSRHFRLPLEIDEKLSELATHYSTTMVYIVCRAIQEEWFKTQRQLRRDERTATAAPKPDERAAKETPKSTDDDDPGGER